MSITSNDWKLARTIFPVVGKSARPAAAASTATTCRALHKRGVWRKQSYFEQSPWPEQKINAILDFFVCKRDRLT
jgi:hypothetical protein